MLVKIISLPFLLTALFTQVINPIYGADTSIQITPQETSIQLRWQVSDLTATYTVIYGVSDNVTDVNTNNVTMPTDINTDATHVIEGLDPGEHYHVQLKKDNILIFQDFLATKPFPVQSVESLTPTANTVTIIWTPNLSSQQDMYQVIVTGTSNTSFQTVSPNITSISYLVPGLQPSQYYTAVVITYSYGQPSNQSTSIQFNTAPLLPLSVSVSAVDNQALNISWSPNPDSTQDGYKIQYMYNATNGNEVEVNKTCDPPTSTTCELRIDDGLPGQVYEIYIYSLLGEAVSEGAMTVHSTLPLPLTSLEEVPSNNDTSLHLRWTMPAEGSTYFRHFLIHLKSEYGELDRTINKDERELVMTHLRLGTRYNVTAYVSTGYEISSPYFQAFYTVPLPIESLTYNTSTDVTTSSITVHWIANDSSLYDSFSININPKPENVNFPMLVSREETEFTFTNLSAGQAYLVTVSTTLDTKTSSLVSDTFRTSPRIPDTVIITNITSSEAIVKWNPPSGEVENYRITLSQSGTELKIVTQTGTTYNILNLEPGTEYDVAIESQSGGLFSGVINQSFKTNPDAVSSLDIVNVTTSSFVATWEAPNSTNFNQYELTISPGNRPVRLASTHLMYSFDSLQAGQLYTVSISTVLGSNIYSEKRSQVVVTNPLAVENLQVRPQGTGLNVSWSINKDSQQSGFEVSYEGRVSRIVKQLPVIVVQPGVLDYTTDIPDLFPGETYMVNVVAWQNVSGESSVSEVREANGTTKPMPVENLTAELYGADGIEVDWLAPTETSHDYYLVRHRPSLQNADAPWVDNRTLTTNLTLVDLLPGERYEIQVYVVSDTDIQSDVKIIHVVLVPLSPLTVDVLTDQTTIDSLTLQWLYDTGATYVESWLVTYTNPAGAQLNKTVVKPISGTTVEAQIGGLEAGYQYEMTVHSVVQKQMSSGITTKAVTKPLNNIALTPGTPSNTTITFTYTLVASEYFDKIIFTQLITKEEIIRLKDSAEYTVMFSNLQPGNMYQVQYQTASGNETSERKTFTTNTAPNPPRLESVVTAYKITLTITPPTGNVDMYRVICTDANNAPIKDVNIMATKDPKVVEIDMLQPYMHYTCTVRSVYMGADSDDTQVSVRTLEAPSSPVRNLKAVESAPREVSLSWSMPEFQNGVISVYMVSYTATLGEESLEDRRNVTFPKSSSLFSNLKAGWTYTFSVRAYTTEPSEAEKITIQLRTYEPSYKQGIQVEDAKPLTDSTAGQRKVKVKFTNVFSDDFGEIIAYTVIVTEDVNSVDVRTKSSLPGWNTARNDPAIKAYQVIRNCSTFFEEGSTCDGKFGVRKRAVNEMDSKVFEIGSETGCENKYYCNGPLNPDTTYYVTLRAYTTMAFRDTPFSEPIRTAAIPTEDKGSNVGGIVGGVIAVLVAIVVMIVIFVVMRRRRTKSNMYRHNPGQELAHRSSVGSKKMYTPVTVAEFRNHVNKLRADSDLGYAEQFEDLKDVGRGQASNAAELPCNRGKNRFTNILPYDHSRVKLLPVDDEEGSDYINANYIPGFYSKREYIATQGPLPATRDDFWRMLWEQNVRNIVMLTKCVEKGREKCDHYWPNSSDAVFYGDLQVAILNETMFPDWTINEFKVSLGDQSRQVRHFHFTSWPDFGVPKKEQVLVRFVRMVREKLQKDGGPIIVHCSAGVGRSGTFIVLDRLLQRIKTQTTLDVFNTVVELRKERVWMVQTEQQYICIHKSLLCVVEGREDEHIYDNVGHSNVAFEDDEGVDLN